LPFCTGKIREYDFGRPSLPGDRFEIFPKFLQEKLPAKDHYQFQKADWASDDDLRLICRKNTSILATYYRMANLERITAAGSSSSTAATTAPRQTRKTGEAARLIVGRLKGLDLVEKSKFPKRSAWRGMHHAKPVAGKDSACIMMLPSRENIFWKIRLQRILILDTDATPATNGGIFLRGPRVLFIDIHQDPHTLTRNGFTTRSGKRRGKGTHQPAHASYAGDECYRMAFEEVILPVTLEFKPQIILRNGGSDPIPPTT